MEHEILEHRKRLDILQKHLGNKYYETGKYHLEISNAMKEYVEQVNGVKSKKEKALHKHVVSFNEVRVEVCRCENPAKVKGKNLCWRCNKPFREFLQT